MHRDGPDRRLGVLPLAIFAQVDALYGQPQRLLHPSPELDCAFESICETCTFFQTSIEFRPTLQAQHDHAINKHQDHRGQLFAALLARVDQDAS